MKPARKPLFLASACLCGFTCRYDGRAATVALLATLQSQGLVLPICPEAEGGLGVPRPPCELLAGRGITRDGEDVTEQLRAGAAMALALALKHGIKLAVLKESSPSCGVRAVHDGTFSGRLVPGRGITADLLASNGISVVNEHEFP